VHLKGEEFALVWLFIPHGGYFPRKARSMVEDDAGGAAGAVLVDLTSP